MIDRYGRKKVALISLISTPVLYFCLSIKVNYNVFFFIRILLSISYLNISLQPILADIIKEKSLVKSSTFAVILVLLFGIVMSLFFKFLFQKNFGIKIIIYLVCIAIFIFDLIIFLGIKRGLYFLDENLRREKLSKKEIKNIIKSSFKNYHISIANCINMIGKGIIVIDTTYFLIWYKSFYPNNSQGQNEGSSNVNLINIATIAVNLV